VLICEIVCGRCRRCGHLLLTMLLAAGASVWFGDAGLGLFLLWGSATWPRWKRQVITIPLAEVREIWLYTAALVVREWNGRLVLVCRDELPAAEYSCLRRALKQQVEGLL
jgi:integral membrane sensor domain MASE1